MFAPRTLTARPDWIGTDGIKRYSISASGAPVERASFEPRLGAVLAGRPHVDWAATPAFAVFHAGSQYLYLVLAWWQNGNELFVSVSVKDGDVWVEDPTRYSFCVHDLEVIWGERQLYMNLQQQGAFELQQWRRSWYERP